jgi:hypothetical protein
MKIVEGERFRAVLATPALIRFDDLARKQQNLIPLSVPVEKSAVEMRAWKGCASHSLPNRIAGNIFANGNLLPTMNLAPKRFPLPAPNFSGTSTPTWSTLAF